MLDHTSVRVMKPDNEILVNKTGVIYSKAKIVHYKCQNIKKCHINFQTVLISHGRNKFKFLVCAGAVLLRAV